MKRPTERQLWWIAVGAFLCLTLWPIWSARFPPMQDYPDQLFYAEVLRSHNDPGSEYDRYYDFHFHPVYATFYMTTIAFAKVVPIEIAGKLSLSLYPLLIALVVWRIGARARSRSSFVPWGALLFFPFAFNQPYFFGNINYFLSLPIMMLALFAFEDFLAGSMRAWDVVKLVLWQVVLAITHPLSLLLFLALAAVSAISAWRETSAAWKKLAVSLGSAVLVILAVRLTVGGTRLSAVSGLAGTEWLPFSVTTKFFGLMFDGMQPFEHAESRSLFLWGWVFALLLMGVANASQKDRSSPLQKRYLLLLGLSIVAMFALPFQVGDFSYLNVRVAALAYFFIALCAAQIPFNKWLAGGLVALLGGCLVDSIAKQGRISDETNEIVTVLRRIPPRARILPLLFDAGSNELDRFWFAPHNQDHNYYHVLVGGGFNPYLLGCPVDPVRPKAGERRPAPLLSRPREFSWDAHAADYQYFLVRGDPVGLQPLERHCNRVCTSNRWMLYARNAH